MERMAVISAGFVPVPAVDGGAGEVLTTEIINGNEKKGDYFMDIYTVESPKLNSIKYNNAEIIQIHISKWNWFFCKARNAFLKLFRRRFRFIPYNRALLKVFRDNYDVILIENNMQIYEDIYKHAKNGKDNMIYHMHNDIDGTTKPEYLCEFISKTAKRILPVSKYIKNHFNEVAPNKKMNVLYNCIDLEKFNLDKCNEKEKLRSKYNILKNNFVFLYTGRVCPEKGVLELIKAFKRINKDYKQAKLVIVGSSWYNQISRDQYFEELVTESKDCSEDIVFTGYIFPENMPTMYTMGDVLVIPTLCEEAFGVVALEGMAMKIPIVCTNAGGMVEVVDQDCGIIVDKNQDVVEQLYEEMKKMLLDENMRNEFAENGYKKVHSRIYDHKEYYDNFIKCVRNESIL